MKTEISLLITWLLLACNPGAPDSAIEDESAIDLVYDLFSQAYRDLDITLVENIYSDDAIYLSPENPILFGKDQFIGSFHEMFENSKTDGALLDIDFHLANRQMNNEQSVDIGYYHLQQSKGGQLLFTDVGKFITFLKKQPDRSWKFMADGYSPAPVDAWLRNEEGN